MTPEPVDALQRAVTGRLLVVALDEQDNAREAAAANGRATFLASASRDLAMSLDLNMTRAIVQRRSLPRAGAWSIVDVLEPNGMMRRLPVIHPDPGSQKLASSLAGVWLPLPEPARRTGWQWSPRLITADADDATLSAEPPGNLAVLRTIGFGELLVVPLVVRAMRLGTITFATRVGDPPLTPAEITLASDLADRCATALDNARLYREVDILRAAADAASSAKSNFLSSMSHELRTPLNAIGGYAELIEMGLRGPVTAEQQLDLGRIKHNQQHLLTLITEILNFVRSESGRMEYRFTGVPVQAAIDEAAEMLQGAVSARRLVLDRGHGHPDAVMWADADRVRQILINLLMNAVKYSDVGAGPITLGCTETEDVVIIHVTDHGHGIPGDKLVAIFDPFVQLTAGLSNRQGGLGLGLTISRDLARAMQGDLTVMSTVGVGSRFNLSLPRARLDFAERESRSPAAP